MGLGLVLLYVCLSACGVVYLEIVGNSLYRLLENFKKKSKINNEYGSFACDCIRCKCVLGFLQFTLRKC
jgi:hypothetical protein